MPEGISFFRDPFLGLWKDHRTRCHSYYVKRILYTNKERDSSKGIAFAFSYVLTCIALCTVSILHYVLHLHCSRTERGQREGGRGDRTICIKYANCSPSSSPHALLFLIFATFFCVDYSISSMWFKSMWFKSRQWVNLISCSWMSRPLLLYLNAWQKPKMF